MQRWLEEFWPYFKKNIYLYLIILILGIVTFGYWYFIPILLFFQHITFLPLLWFILFLGVLFSLLFLGVNINVAKRKSDKNTLISIVKLQGTTALITSLVIGLIHLFIMVV